MSLQQRNEQIYYDGRCELCNGFLQFIKRIDKKHRFEWIPIQSVNSGNIPPDMATHLPLGMDSVLYWKDGQLLSKSSAVLAILKDVGGIWRCLASAAQIIPKRTRDSLYAWVANNRYKWFGQHEHSCELNWSPADESSYKSEWPSSEAPQEQRDLKPRKSN
jgi:predicted DCC family thiol-disulfide oxidoreductase YuxK